MTVGRCRFEWKFQDLWVGAFWKTTHAVTDAGPVPVATDVWICLLPCVPLHLTVWWKAVIPFDPPGTMEPNP